MGGENPRDGFDVFVIDPASRTVEQVELESTRPVKPAKRRLAKKSAKKGRGRGMVASKRRAPKTAKRIAQRATTKKKRASLPKPVRSKKKRSARVPVVAAAALPIAPKKPRAKKTQPHAPTLQPAPPESVAVAAMVGLADKPMPVDESMMVLELCPPPRPPARQGTIDIRLVDVR
jgi:hypothetical protein